MCILYRIHTYKYYSMGLSMDQHLPSHDLIRSHGEDLIMDEAHFMTRAGGWSCDSGCGVPDVCRL